MDLNPLTHETSHMITHIPDDYQQAIMRKTAVTFQKLAALRGVASTISVNAETGHYEANGIDCGTTTFGLSDWLNAQPGVKP